MTLGVKGIENIWSGFRNMLKTSTNEKYKLIHLWKFPGQPAHAGQFFTKKVLPNGNIQQRLVTQYGNPGVVGISTKVYTPKGELLKAYAGIRAPEGTRIYGNSQGGLPEAIKRLYNTQGNCYRF